MKTTLITFTLIFSPVVAMAGPLESSVRIRVYQTENTRPNMGSGTAYALSGDDTFILTCAHIFSRWNPESGVVKVDLYNNRSQAVHAWDGHPLAIDYGHDLAVVRIDGTMPVIPLADRSARVNELVSTVGCSYGKPPTYWPDLRVLTTGNSRLRVSRPPWPGRSGGGLFRGDSEIIGVTVTTDWMTSGGYVGLRPVLALDRRVSKEPGIAPELREMGKLRLLEDVADFIPDTPVFYAANPIGENLNPGAYSNNPTTPVVEKPAETPPQTVSFDPVSAARGQWFMSQERERHFRALLPRTDDERINATLTDPNLILYTDREMPLARQNWSNVSNGVHSILYDISGGADHIGRGSAHEFPWADPAGTDQVPDGELVEFRGVLLPRHNGRPLPIAYYRTTQESHRSMNIGVPQKYEWVYPHGTTFIELLARRLGNGSVVPFELRVRFRERGEWGVDVFRPYVNREDLDEALAQVGENRLAARPTLRRVTLHDDFHPARQEINLSANVEQLPRYSDRTVESLIRNRVFESALGDSWSEQAAIPAGGVNPDRYRAVMDVDRRSCMNCHRSANKHASLFDPRRDWYGNVRGGDAIISFHVFDQSCISTNGTNKPVVFRRELVRWGLLEPYDRRKHSREYYSALE